MSRRHWPFLRHRRGNGPSGRRAAGTPADRLLLHTVRAQPGRTALLIGTALAEAGAALVLPAALGRAVDAVLGGRSTGSVLVLFGLLLGLGLLGEFGYAVLRGQISAEATRRLRHRMVRHLIGRGPVRPGSDGDLLSRVLNGTADAASVAPTLVSAAGSVLTAVGGFVALALIDLRLFAILLAGAPVALLVARLFVRDVTALSQQYQEVQGGLSGRFVDAMAGVRTIRASGTVEVEVSRVLAPLPGLGAAGRALWAAQRSAGWQLALLAPALQVAVLAAAGTGVAAGRISPGEMLATISYLTLALGFLSQVMVLGQVARARGAAARVAEIVAAPAPQRGTRPLPPGPGRLQLRSVTVRAADGRPLLDRVDLEVPPGIVLAVVGSSGTGKSTLAAGAGGLVRPDDGAVLLDGVPLAEADPDQVRAAVCYAFERPVLLGDTVADAVGYADVPPPAAAIEAAARACHAHAFVTRLPDGYRTPVGALRLSGGEMQRLGLARAAWRPARLVVLDDALSSLDLATEARVTTALQHAFAGRTRLVVAHRAGTAARADLVAWLDGGRVRAVGPPGLLSEHPDYRRLFGADSATAGDAGTGAGRLPAAAEVAG